MMQTTQGRAGNIWNKKETHYLAPLKTKEAIVAI